MPLLFNKNTAAVSELTKDISPFAPARLGPHNVHPSPNFREHHNGGYNFC